MLMLMELIKIDWNIFYFNKNQLNIEKKIKLKNPLKNLNANGINKKLTEIYFSLIKSNWNIFN